MVPRQEAAVPLSVPALLTRRSRHLPRAEGLRRGSPARMRAAVCRACGAHQVPSANSRAAMCRRSRAVIAKAIKNETTAKIAPIARNAAGSPPPVNGTAPPSKADAEHAPQAAPPRLEPWWTGRARSRLARIGPQQTRLRAPRRPLHRPKFLPGRSQCRRVPTRDRVHFPQPFGRLKPGSPLRPQCLRQPCRPGSPASTREPVLIRAFVPRSLAWAYPSDQSRGVPGICGAEKRPATLHPAQRAVFRQEPWWVVVSHSRSRAFAPVFSVLLNSCPDSAAQMAAQFRPYAATRSTASKLSVPLEMLWVWRAEQPGAGTAVRTAGRLWRRSPRPWLCWLA